MTTNNNYKGYPIFNEIEDQKLRVRNCAVIMANIFEDNTVGKVISQRGASLLVGYMKNVQVFDRKLLVEEFKRQMKERGYEEAE